MIYLDSNRWHEAFINLCLVHKISYYIQDEEANYYSHSQTHLITQTDILTDTRLSDVFTIQLFLRNTYSSAFFTLFTKNTLLSDKVSWVVCYDSTSSMRYRGYVKLQLLYVCTKGYPNQVPNGREKREYTDTQTHKHFRIYISRDWKMGPFVRILNFKKI